MIRQLRSEGTGIVLISHKMREIREIADRVTVLRAGKIVLSDVPTGSLTDAELVTAMVGETVAIARNTGAAVATDRAAAMALDGVSLAGAGEGGGLRDATLHVYPGEILGVAGVSGNGQRELADLLVGASRPDRGTIAIGGQVREDPTPAAFHAAGVASVPADPLREFVVPGLTIAEHASLWHHTKTGARFDSRSAAKSIEQTGKRLGLSLAHPSRQLDQLSGGNIQRVLLALALGQDVNVLVVSYPTRGLDVLTTETTRQLLIKARDAGTAVVLISEDLDEILRLSDRIAVLSHGRVSAVVPGAGADRQSLGHLMTAHAA